MKDIPDLLKRNLAILAQHQPQLADVLRRHLDGLADLKEPLFQETPAGRWVSGMTEAPFFEKQALLEKRRKAAPSAVYLIFGTGCAPWLFHALRSLPREALSIIVFEPSLDLLLHTLSQTSVFQALPPGCRISFLTGKDRSLIDEAFSWNVVPVGIYPVSKAIPIVHEGEREAVDFTEVEHTFRKQIIYRLTMLGNSPEDTLLGLRHAVLNTPRIIQSPSLGELKEAYGGKPFVSVASGPSLEKNVHLLDDIQDKCVIVACDTILFHLLERGVVPHVVTTIERPYRSYAGWLPRVLANYRDQCKGILLLSQSVSYPLTAGTWPGPRIVVGKLDVPVDNWFTGGILGEQLLYSGLSVAHMALSLAFLCEASSVALIGQDLAYSEEGKSHASKTVSTEVLNKEQSRREGILVSASLGGVIETNNIWLTFIQLFERMIAAAGPNRRVHDCTEGGALIEGAKVTPFLEFIQSNILSPDTSVSRWHGGATSKKIRYDELLVRFGQAFDQLQRVNSRLDDMRSGIDKCTAPALLPERRQELALSVGDILDEIHAMNPVIAFIGQSYTHLSGAVLAENRFLETVEQVTLWKKLHEDILDSHTHTVAFSRQWLGYARDLVDVLRSGAFDEITKSGEKGEKIFVELFDSMNREDGEQPLQDRSTTLILLADILSCNDPLEEWSPDSLWKAALLLFGQGRADEARRFMAKAYSQMEGEELPYQEIGTFFKDWGKIAAADDLCTFPVFSEAMIYLSNAKEYLPEDQEIVSLRKSIMERQRGMFAELEKIQIRAEGTKEIEILMLRNKAESALLEEDLPTALLCVEQFVWETIDSYRSMAISHLQWLLKTAASCTRAVDTKVADISSQILYRIIARLPELLQQKIDFPAEFLEFLKKAGVKVSIEMSETKDVN